MSDDTPFAEDCAVQQLLDRFGLVLDRREAIEITDESAIKERGLMRSCPDYSRIRKAIVSGMEIPGVRMRGVEYILRRRTDAE